MHIVVLKTCLRSKQRSLETPPISQIGPAQAHPTGGFLGLKSSILPRSCTCQSDVLFSFRTIDFPNPAIVSDGFSFDLARSTEHPAVLTADVFCRRMQVAISRRRNVASETIKKSQRPGMGRAKIVKIKSENEVDNKKTNIRSHMAIW